MQDQTENRVGGYRKYPCPLELDHAVEGLWTHVPPSRPESEHLGLPQLEPSTHRVVPYFGACLTLERSFDSDGRLGSSRVLFLGPVSQPRFYAIESGREMISLRLRPEHCRRLLGVDIRETWDAIVDYSTLAPSSARELFDELAQCHAIPQVFASLSGWLVRRSAGACVAAGPSSEALHGVLEHLRRRHGNARVDRLVRAHGRTPQYLRRVFREHLGATPKKIARLLRLEAAVERGDASSRPDWADIAAHCGYADQAHLAHEMKRWTGASPTVLHAERRAEMVPYRADGGTEEVRPGTAPPQGHSELRAGAG